MAFWWSAVFLFLYDRSARIREVAASRFGALKVAAVYGPLIWIFMSCVVIPLFLHRPPNIRPRWFVQLIGHIFFVGLPIVSMIRVNPRRSDLRPAPAAGSLYGGAGSPPAQP